MQLTRRRLSSSALFVCNKSKTVYASSASSKRHGPLQTGDHIPTSARWIRDSVILFIPAKAIIYKMHTICPASLQTAIHNTLVLFFLGESEAGGCILIVTNLPNAYAADSSVAGCIFSLIQNIFSLLSFSTQCFGTETGKASSPTDHGITNTKKEEEAAATAAAAAAARCLLENGSV